MFCLPTLLATMMLPTILDAMLTTCALLSGVLDLCLDLNQTPSIPPELRFDISIPARLSTSAATIVPPNITPEQGNHILNDYQNAVQNRQIPPLDLLVIREQIDDRLAAQGVTPLSKLEATVSHPSVMSNDLLEDIRAGEQPGYLTPDQEAAYLIRLDARLGDPYGLPKTQPLESQNIAGTAEERPKHHAEFTPRELERKVELENPQSQHNWLRNHTKLAHVGAGDLVDDNESLASHQDVKPPTARRKGGGGGSKKDNLAKQVGDRAVERAREGYSPGAGSGFEEDELAVGDDAVVGSGWSKKRSRDPDGTYRLKGGKGGGSSAAKGSKRKRSGEDVGSSAGGGGKKPKVEGGMD